MKRIILSILAVAALASCSKTESAYVDQDQEIRMAPVTAMTTKAKVNKAIDGTTYPSDEHFTVIGYWAKEGAGSVFTTGTTYLDAVDFARKGLYWAGANQSYYWPKNGSLRFACYSPTEIDGGTLTHDLATDTWTAMNYVQSNDTEKTIDFMVAQTPASYTAETATENVSVVFEHALSWLEFKVKAQDAAAAKAFDVKAITVNNVFTQGNMVAKYPAKDWTVIENSQCGYAVCTDAPALPENLSAALVPNTGVLVIPQATTTLTVTFVQNTLPDVEQSLEIPLVLDVENTPWEAGKHYIYTLIFGLDEILINPSVADWEDVEVNDIPATNVVAYTEAELIAAVNNGGQVRLGADIELNNTLNVDEDINVDFAGYTVTMKADNYAFLVTNGATLTLGRGAVVTTGTDAGYVARVDGENSKIIVNSGNYSTNGDCTLFYAADKGVVEVYGGYFETDTKDEWKQYMLNLKDNTGAKITVYGGTFVNWNPADNAAEGKGTNFVAAGYNVTSVENGDNTEYTVSAVEGNVTLVNDTEAITTLNLSDNAVLDGGNKTITLTEGSDLYLTSSTLRLICTNGSATIKNLTIDGNNVVYDADNDASTSNYGIRGIYLTGKGVVNIDNVKIKNVTYTLNDDSAEKTINVTNSELEGWTSYNPATTGNFTNVKFQKGTYNTFRPQGNTVLTNCDFGDDFVVNLDLLAAGKTVKFDKCTYKGAVITADNYTELVKNATAGAVVF